MRGVAEEHEPAVDERVAIDAVDGVDQQRTVAGDAVEHAATRRQHFGPDGPEAFEIEIDDRRGHVGRGGVGVEIGRAVAERRHAEQPERSPVLGRLRSRRFRRVIDGPTHVDAAPGLRTGAERAVLAHRRVHAVGTDDDIGDETVLDAVDYGMTPRPTSRRR